MKPHSSGVISLRSAITSLGKEYNRVYTNFILSWNFIQTKVLR